MKILFLTSYDATNFSLANIMKEFIKRKHEVLIYPVISDFQNIRMFQNIKNIVWLDQLTNEEAEHADIIFCANDTVWKVAGYKKYIFGYSCLTLGNAISEGADFLFIAGDTQRYDLVEKCPFMKIGNPVYDNYSCDAKRTKNILFIDSGHYPFGNEGKLILAELILNICDKYSGYTVTVKPRFFPSDKVCTHVNKNHLYSNIMKLCEEHGIPGNLILLDKHFQMRELVENADTVLCMYTSAYLDAAVCNKGIIIIDGLPNEDSYDLNNKFHWKMARKTMEETGCLVHYTKVMDYLPYGIKCSKEHLNNELRFRDGVSARIVEVVEHVFSKYLLNHKYLPEQEYAYENYIEEMENSQYIGFEKVISNRIYNKSVMRIARLRDCIDHDLDISSIISDLECLQRENLLTITNMLGVDRYVDESMDELLIKNKDNLMQQDIKCSYLLPVLFKKSPKEAMELMENLAYEMRGTLYFQACYLEKQNNYKAALCLFQKYLELVENADYERYSTDTHYFVSSALYHLAMCHYVLGSYDKAYEIFRKCNQYEGYRHGAAQYMMCKMALHNCKTENEDERLFE